VRPNDKDAKAKYTECNKIVKMQAFAKAIAVDHSKSIAETLDIASMGEQITFFLVTREEIVLSDFFL